jgi:hypothetical protein
MNAVEPGGYRRGLLIVATVSFVLAGAAAAAAQQLAYVSATLDDTCSDPLETLACSRGLISIVDPAVKCNVNHNKPSNSFVDLRQVRLGETVAKEFIILLDVFRGVCRHLLFVEHCQQRLLIMAPENEFVLTIAFFLAVMAINGTLTHIVALLTDRYRPYIAALEASRG